MTRWSRVLRGPNPPTLAAAFTVSGIVHFAAPKVFESIVPHRLPRHRELVYASGAAELVCAAGLLTKRRWAGPATAAVLLAVWPANLQMAVDASRSTRSPSYKAAAWARLPLQIPLIAGALRAGSSPR